MLTTLILPWLPIILAVGVGGRLLGRSRGLAMGVLCSLFWVVLVRASVSPVLLQSLWAFFTVLAGSAAIIAMGAWSGDIPIVEIHGESQRSSYAGEVVGHALKTTPNDLTRIAASVERFDDWLARHGRDPDPWPAFDEFLREFLRHVCQATHVRAYRYITDCDQLVPIYSVDPLSETDRISARKGIIGHVATSGRTYHQGDATQGELLSQLAGQSSEETAWCFAVRQGNKRLGVVTIGHLSGLHSQPARPLFQIAERLTHQYWAMVLEAQRCRSAEQVDPVAGIRSRPAFLAAAESALSRSYDQGEPVALAVIAVEGLRGLTDSGNWELGDELIREISDVLRRKIRMDDCLGRFDGSRFALLLCRVDSGLASLIVSQTITRVVEICKKVDRWGGEIKVRCGVAGSGTGRPELAQLVTRALGQCQSARVSGTLLGSDLDQPTPVEVVSV